MILENSEKGWIVQLFGEQYEDVSVPNYLASNTYCFTCPEDKKIAYMVIIMVEECWDSEIKMSTSESLHIYAHLEEIICLETLEMGLYELVL